MVEEQPHIYEDSQGLVLQSTGNYAKKINIRVIANTDDWA
jgi:hypothetical protein